MKLLFMEDLGPQKNIPFSRPHLFRLIKAGKFPRPIKIGENRNAFIEAEIDKYIEERIAKRDAAGKEAA